MKHREVTEAEKLIEPFQNIIISKETIMECHRVIRCLLALWNRQQEVKQQYEVVDGMFTMQNGRVRNLPPGTYIKKLEANHD